MTVSNTLEFLSIGKNSSKMLSSVIEVITSPWAQERVGSNLMRKYFNYFSLNRQLQFYYDSLERQLLHVTSFI